MKSPRNVGVVGSGQSSNTGQQHLGGPEIRGWFSDSIQTFGVFQQQEFRTVNTKLNDSADFKPKVCGKPRMLGNQVKHALAPGFSCLSPVVCLSPSVTLWGPLQA